MKAYTGMPVVRIGRHLLFPGGATRRVSLRVWWAYKRGRLTTVTAETEHERRGLV